MDRRWLCRNPLHLYIDLIDNSAHTNAGLPGILADLRSQYRPIIFGKTKATPFLYDSTKKRQKKPRIARLDYKENGTSKYIKIDLKMNQKDNPRDLNPRAPLLKIPECCKNKACIKCYGGVFKKASPDELASREIFVRSKSLKKEADTICAICLRSLTKYRFIWKLSCNHHFHYNCIAQWSNLQNYTCPLCRKYYDNP